MNFAIIKDSESDLLKQIEDFHPDDSNLWKLPNIIIPIATIILALICQVAFSDTRGEILRYFNLILNGSLPLIAINQISAIGLHVLRFDKTRERSYGLKSTLMLRTKLLTYSIGVLVFGTILFAFQVINNPFSSNWLISFIMLISILLVWLSSFISKRIFLLQEEFIERTFYKDIIVESEEKHGKDW